MMYDYKKTRYILEELNYLVFYRDTGIRHVQKYLGVTLGLDKKTVDKISKRRSRWTLVSKNSPRYVMTENEAIII